MSGVCFYGQRCSLRIVLYMAGIVDNERYVIDMSLSGKNTHLSTRLATERLSMTGLHVVTVRNMHHYKWALVLYPLTLNQLKHLHIHPVN